MYDENVHFLGTQKVRTSIVAVDGHYRQACEAASSKGRESLPKRMCLRAIFYELLVLQGRTQLAKRGNGERQTVPTKNGLKSRTSVYDVVCCKSRSSESKAVAYL